MRSAISRPRPTVSQRYARGQLPRNFTLPTAYRLRHETEAAIAGEGVRDRGMCLVEAALMAADEPLPLRKLARIAGLSDAAEARKIVQRLHYCYEADGSAFQIEEIAGGFQLLTRPEYHRWLVRLRSFGTDLRLSTAALDTLAIIAYRQPIMRAAVEEIRGVQSGEILRTLMEKGLVRIVGRDQSLGRPVLYGTTKKFLQYLGLRSLRDLPTMDDAGKRSRRSTPRSNDGDTPPSTEPPTFEGVK